MKEFIKRAQELCKTTWDEYREKRRQKINKWNNENREFLRECIKKYSKTKKGKRACIRRGKNREIRFKLSKLDLTKEEKEKIRQFYINRPDGMEVDHILPLYLGGKHHISNLQYLTKEQNRLKGRNVA